VTLQITQHKSAVGASIKTAARAPGGWAGLGREHSVTLSATPPRWRPGFSPGNLSRGSWLLRKPCRQSRAIQFQESKAESSQLISVTAAASKD